MKSPQPWKKKTSSTSKDKISTLFQILLVFFALLDLDPDPVDHNTDECEEVSILKFSRMWDVTFITIWDETV